MQFIRALVCISSSIKGNVRHVRPYLSRIGNCQGIIAALPADERAGFDMLYGECKEAEQAKAVMLAGAQPAMMFKMEIVETESERAAAEMLVGLGQPILLPPGGSLPPLITTVGDPSDEQQKMRHQQTGAVGVSEFRRVCSRANLTVCAPPCNPTSDGFLLSVRDQRMPSDANFDFAEPSDRGRC
jgi:hypothetical protein